MTITMTRPAVPPLTAPAPPARGSAQRAAVITLILAVIFQPVLHPTGPGNSSPVDLLLIASIVTATVWLAGTHRKLRAPYVIPVALFIAAGAASGLVSPLPTTALTTIAIDILLFAWCTTVVNVLSAPRAMRYALVAWSWSGIFWAALFVAAWAGHVTPLEGINPAEGNRLASTFGDPNYASWYWDATILVIFASRTPGKRWMRFAGYAILLWALVLTESNGGALGARHRHHLPADGQELPAAWLGRGHCDRAGRRPGRRRLLHRRPAQLHQAVGALPATRRCWSTRSAAARRAATSGTCSSRRLSSCTNAATACLVSAR